MSFAPGEPYLTPFDGLCDALIKGLQIETAPPIIHISVGKYDIGPRVTWQLNQRGLLGPDKLLSHCKPSADDELDATLDDTVGISSVPNTEMQMYIW